MKKIRPMCLLCFLLGAVLMLFLCTFAPSAHRLVNAREHTIPPPAAFTTRLADLAHPLGTLEAIPFPLAHPDGIFPDREDRLRQPEWIFQNFSETDLQHFLDGSALDAEEKQLIFDTHNWRTESNCCVIKPPDPL